MEKNIRNKKGEDGRGEERRRIREDKEGRKRKEEGVVLGVQKKKER